MDGVDFSKLKQIFQSRPEIDTVVLFGSAAKGRLRKDSDLDFAFLLSKKDENSFEYASKLAGELDEVCKRESDVLIFNTASPHIAFRAIKEGKIIYQKNDRRLWNAFVVKTISMNEDMEILYRKVRSNG
jgi:uncharacterized protein